MLYPLYFASNDTKGYWNTNNTTVGGYKSSLAHSNTNQIATNMKNDILGIHLVNRNVLLSSSIDSNGFANAYTWTTAYGTLPSFGQLAGSFHYDNTIYDEGEANYKLPYFNTVLIGYFYGYDFWLRNIHKKENSDYNAYFIYGMGYKNYAKTNYEYKYYHPLLYVR